jgi:hypothetical protein
LKRTTLPLVNEAVDKTSRFTAQRIGLGPHQTWIPLQLIIISDSLNVNVSAVIDLYLK